METLEIPLDPPLPLLHYCWILYCLPDMPARHCHYCIIPGFFIVYLICQHNMLFITLAILVTSLFITLAIIALL